MKQTELSQSKEVGTKFQCSRRSESWIGSAPQFQRENDYDASDDSCSYCGSLNPDTFMVRVQAGDVLLGATDKSYKVYVKNDGGTPFKQSYRDCPRDSNCAGLDECEHWITRETNSTKFYFQHLNDEQKNIFFELLKQGRLKFSGGIGFYVLPFFICRK